MNNINVLFIQMMLLDVILMEVMQLLVIIKHHQLNVDGIQNHYNVMKIKQILHSWVVMII